MWKSQFDEFYIVLFSSCIIFLQSIIHTNIIMSTDCFAMHLYNFILSLSTSILFYTIYTDTYDSIHMNEFRIIRNRKIFHYHRCCAT